jgi:ATP-binding cassette subfamily C protein LapB
MGIYGERNQRTSADDHAKANSRAQQMGQFLLSSGEAVRALPLIGPLSRRWGEIQDASLGSRRQGMDLQSTLQTSIQSIGQLLTVLVYGAGAIAVVRGDLTTGALIGANILVSRAFAVTSRAAYLADPLLRATRADAALKKIEAIERETETGATPRNLEGALELVDVAFSYPQQPVPLFERLDLSLAPGQVLVISGPNGAGKSTLVKLMLGLLTPKRGLVRADRIELRQLSQDWWRARVGYAPQEAAFFDGTLRENLLLDREIDDGVLLDEIRAMGLDSFLAADPNGLDRPISSHETGLAMGLRRRFVLIRAVLGNPDVIFLDDPTEGLDQAGQAAVAQLLNRLVKQRKTLVVASNEAFILRAADLVVDMTKKPTPTVTRPVQNLALTAEPTVVS